MLTPERELQIRRQTPRRDHVDCGERATAIWDLLDEVERLRVLAEPLLSALEEVLPYAESRAEDLNDDPECNASAQQAADAVANAQAVVDNARGAS